MAGIRCPNAALDFDLACTIRLQQYDLEAVETQAKRIAYEVSKIFGSGEDDGGDAGGTPVETW